MAAATFTVLVPAASGAAPAPTAAAGHAGPAPTLRATSARQQPQLADPALLVGIPQQGARLGRADAPVVLDEFVDLQCPYCAEFARRALPLLINRFVRPGKLQIRLLPLTFIGRDSVRAARFVSAAGLQNREWQFAVRFYLAQGRENSGYVTATFVRRLAAEVPGLDGEALLAAAGGRAVGRQLRSAATLAKRRDVSGVPQLFLGRRGGPMHPLELQSLGAGEVTRPIARLLASKSQQPPRFARPNG